MVKNLTKLWLVAAMMLFGVAAYGQVTIGSTTYSNLATAFNAVNAGTHTGDIVMQITNNITESSVPTLYGSGVGNADYSSILIYPTGTYTIQISNSNGVLWLQGADNVTIDGRANQSGNNRNLTFKNNSSGAVIRIDSLLTSQDPANYNKIMYCNITGGSKTGSYGVCLSTSSSYTGSASSTGNEIAYNHLRMMYQGVRVYSTSGREVLDTKIYGNIFGSSTLTESVSYQPLYIYYTKNTEIYDNVFDYIDYTSTIYVMYVYYSNNVKIYNNTIQNSNAPSSFYSIYAVTCSDAEIYGNTINNVKSAGAIYGVYLSSGPYAKIYNNTLTNLSANSTYYGIYLSSGTYSQVYGNTIRNTSNTTTSYGYYFSSCSYSDIYNNTFENFTNSGTSTNYGMYLTSTSYSNVNDNKFVNLTNGGYFYTFYVSSCTESKFQRNIVDKIYSNSASATGAIGFYVLSSNNSVFANNSISNLLTTRYSTGNTTNPVGFLFTSGTGYKLYFNSVNLTGEQFYVGSSLSQPVCLWISSTSVNSLDVRNNNFYNDVVSQSGSWKYAIYLAGTGNLTSSTFDYNNYYVSGSNAAIGYLNGNQTSLANWKSATSREANSTNFDPMFNSSSVLAPFTGSPILGKGTSISGYTTDIIGVNRNASTPTPGCYEEADDIVGPDIQFSKLFTTTSLDNRVVVAKITDRTGVSLASSEPRLYYRKASQENTYYSNSSSTSGWKYATAMQNGDEFTFVLDYSRINGGISVGDVIEYFIIAQDIATKKNISVTSGNFTNYPTSTNLSAANFPMYNVDSYRLAASVSGNFNVGTNQTYTSLTGANGFFKFVNDNVVNGDVNVYITSNISETNEVALNNINYEGGTFTITIRPNSATERILSGDIAGGALIRLIGASNVVFDGNYDGDGKYLSITNTSSTSPRACLMIGSNSGTGGNNITIQNCNIYHSNFNATSIAVVVSDGAISTSSSANNLSNLTIRNNWIYNSQMGILARGGTSTGQFLYNLLIEGNQIGHSNTSSQIYQFGIDVQNAPSGMIRRNTIFNINNTASSKWGIQLGSTTLAAGIICDGNYINKIWYTSTGGWGAYGINIISGNNHVLMNNMISDIKTDRYSLTSTTYNPFGIRIAGGSGHKIWHNTIVMTGNQQATNSTASLTANILYVSSYTSMDIRGNILHNSLQGVSGTRSFNIFLYTSSIGSAFAQLDHNLYSIGGAAGVIGGYGTSSPFVEAASLSAWKSLTGRDANSRQGQPIFVDMDNNLHINSTSIGNSNFMYGGIPEITTDAEGEVRNNPTYYGADEVNAIFKLVSDTKVSPDIPVQCVNDVATVSFDPQVTGFGDGIVRSGISTISMQWYKNGQVMSGFNGKNVTFNPLKMADSARYYATATFMGKTLVGSEILMKVETPIGLSLQPVNSDVCTTTPNLYLYTNPIGNIFGYQWEFRKAGTSEWVDVPGATHHDLERLMEDAENSVGDYRLKISGPGNCGPSVLYSDISSVTLSDPLDNISIAQVEQSAGKDLTHTCFGDYITLQTSVTGTIFGYRWQRDAGQGFVDLSPAQYPSAHTPTLYINNADPNESGSYRCKILGSASCGTAERFTDAIPIRVWPYFSLDQQPESKTLCIGENSFIRVNITGVVYNYQWYKDGVKMTAADNPYYDKPVLYIDKANFDHDGEYTCKVEAEDCFGYISLTSEPASVYVVTGTEITNAPFTQAVIEGDNVTFRLRAHVNGAPEGTKPEVQWYKGNTPLVDGPRFAGTKSDVLMIRNVQAADFGEDYRVVVQGKCGLDEARNFGIIKGTIQITEQPQNVDACQDEHIILSVRANTNIPEAVITYQWYRDGIKLSDAGNITGTNSQDLHLNPADKYLSGSYYCLVKPQGSVTGLATVDAIVRIENKAEITSQPTASVSLKVDETLALTVEAVGNDLTYQWYFNDTPIDGEDQSTLMIYNMKEENSGKYYVAITNSCGTINSIVSDVLVVPTATDVDDNNLSSLSLGVPTPNPANSNAEVTFNLPLNTNAKLVLVNSIGEEVAVLLDAIANEGANNLMINVEKFNLNSGVYNLVLKVNGAVVSQRFVIVR